MVYGAMEKNKAMEEIQESSLEGDILVDSE